MAGNTFLRPLVSLIERAPIDESATEATFELRITVDQNNRDELRDELIEQLERANYPIQDIEEIPRENKVELVAILMPSSVIASELDSICSSLQSNHGVNHATWTSKATD